MVRVWPATPVRPSDHELQQYHAHHEPSFVEVVGIRVKDSILRARGCHKVKPRADRLWVFGQGLLAIVPASPAGFELRRPFDKVIWPADSNGFATARLEERICHTAG